MKIPKVQKNFRLTEETRITLQVLAEMTGDSMTHILEECIRPGKKTYARQRGLDYKIVLENIRLTRSKLYLERQKKAEDELSKHLNGQELTDKNITDSDKMRHEIKIANAKWLTDEGEEE